MSQKRHFVDRPSDDYDEAKRKKVESKYNYPPSLLRPPTPPTPPLQVKLAGAPPPPPPGVPPKIPPPGAPPKIQPPGVPPIPLAVLPPKPSTTLPTKPTGSAFKSISLQKSKPSPTISIQLGQPKKGPSGPVASSGLLKNRSTKVAELFNQNDSSDEEEMPLEAKMKMRNIGRDTITSSGPNSFGKTKQGFCDDKKLFERKLKAAMENVCDD